MNGYRCICDNGYEGTNCEANTDDCIANACIFGICVVSVYASGGAMFEVAKSILLIIILLGWSGKLQLCL